MVNTVGEEPIGKVTLSFVGQQNVFVAPVWHADDDVGVHALRFRDVAGDDRCVDEVHHTGFGDAYAVGAVGVVEQADTYAVVLDDERV